MKPGRRPMLRPACAVASQSPSRLRLTTSSIEFISGAAKRVNPVVGLPGLIGLAHSDEIVTLQSRFRHAAN